MTIVQMIVPMLLFNQPASEDLLLKVLQQKAASTRISLTKDENRKVSLVEKPVFRYTDELRHIEQAGIWIWTERGRPAATMKVEHYREGKSDFKWLYCFTSLSPELITAEWDGNPTFHARQPGVTWRTLDDQPAATRALRLVQMRDIARRYSAEIMEWSAEATATQMRLLPRPLYRYDEGLADITDGALFGFTGTGTNPDLLLLLELPKEAGWRIGFAGMTACGIKVRLDDEIMWQIAHKAGQGFVFDNWTYFVPKE